MPIFSSALVNHAQARPPPFGQCRPLVLYAFCETYDDFSLASILSALIRQTLEQHRDTLNIAHKLDPRSQYQGALPTVDELVDVLTEIRKRFGAAYVILDPPGAADAEAQESLLEIFKRINFSIFVTSHETDAKLLSISSNARICQVQPTMQDIRSLTTNKLKHLCLDGRIFDLDVEDVVAALWDASPGT